MAPEDGIGAACSRRLLPSSDGNGPGHPDWDWGPRSRTGGHGASDWEDVPWAPRGPPGGHGTGGAKPRQPGHGRRRRRRQRKGRTLAAEFLELGRLALETGVEDLYRNLVDGVAVVAWWDIAAMEDLYDGTEGFEAVSFDDFAMDELFKGLLFALESHARMLEGHSTVFALPDGQEVRAPPGLAATRRRTSS